MTANIFLALVFVCDAQTNEARTDFFRSWFYVLLQKLSVNEPI